MLALAPLDAGVAVASAIVSALADLVAPLAGSAATAAAIVLFTLAVRLLISPLTWAQVRGERRHAALALRVRELQQRYGHDRARSQAELTNLYRSAGATPLAGCLPALLQAPFFLLMYRLFTTSTGERGLLTERLFTVPLGQHVGDGLAGPAGPVFGVLFVLLGGLAWWSSRRMRRAAVAADGAVAGDVPGAAVFARILPLLPYGTLVVAAVVPLAAVLYLVVTTAWTAAEQAVLRRPPRR
jgi:YidC/Oxa1 family membrane protein insertase